MELETHQKIRVLREKSGFSQKVFADYIGMSASSFAKYEQGTTQITLPLLQIFSKALKVKSYELMPDSEVFLREFNELKNENELLKKLLKNNG